MAGGQVEDGDQHDGHHGRSHRGDPVQHAEHEGVGGLQHQQQRSGQQHDAGSPQPGHDQCGGPGHQQGDEGDCQLGMPGHVRHVPGQSTSDECSLHFHARCVDADRRGVPVTDAGGRGAHQHDAVPKARRVHPALDDIGGGDVLEAPGLRAGLTGEGDARRQVACQRQPGLGIQRQQLPVQGDGRVVAVDAQHGQRQRFVDLTIEEREHRDGTDHAVVVELGVVETAAAGGVAEALLVGAKAIPLGQQPAIEGMPFKDRGRQTADATGTGLTGEVVAQHHRPTADGLGQRQIPGRLGLGKHDVEAQHAGPPFIDDALDQPGQRPARPGPAPLLLQALLVDVDDEHPGLEFRRLPAQPVILVQTVEGLHGRHGHMAQQHQDGQYRDSQPPDGGPQPERAQQRMHRLQQAIHRGGPDGGWLPAGDWLNWMMVPLSSIRSWLRKGCAPRPIDSPLTIG